MRSRVTLTSFILVSLLACAAPRAAIAAGGKKADGEPKADGKAEDKPKDDLQDVLKETKHSVRIGGQVVAYTATAGHIVMKDEDGAAKAKFFFVAYMKDGAGDKGRRPITFSFNGGPGSSSVWLHLGAFGPRRVLMDEKGFPLPPPYRLVENDQSILDLTDLVFIDPVMTGYSRPAAGEEANQFHGVKADIESVGEFIRLFTTRFGRWSSPKFLAGESYGTTRAAGLAGYLQERHGMYLNGILLVSSILNFQTARFNDGNDLPYVVFLPTEAATAWYHGALAPDLQASLARTLEEAESFAAGEYASALMKGDRLVGEDRRAVATALARLTGLSPDYVERSNLRVPAQAFFKELLRDEGKTVGRLDSRFTGRDRDSAGDSAEFDPSYAAIQGPYTATLNDYVRGELRYESDLPYEILTGRVQPWSYKEYENRYVDVAETLRGAMHRNPALKVFVANGYYDVATPYFATEYTFAHMGVAPELRENVTMTYYESGHMMYIDLASLARLKADLVTFYRGALPH